MEKLDNQKFLDLLSKRRFRKNFQELSVKELQMFLKEMQDLILLMMLQEEKEEK